MPHEIPAGGWRSGSTLAAFLRISQSQRGKEAEESLQQHASSLQCHPGHFWADEDSQRPNTKHANPCTCRVLNVGLQVLVADSQGEYFLQGFTCSSTNFVGF